MKKRTGDPWIPAPAYGALLPPFTVNLVARSIDQSVEFYRTVLEAHVHYADPDFAALKVHGLEVMLHADHTYEHNAWASALGTDEPRGIGAELRLLGVDPDSAAERARAVGAVVSEPRIRGHGWREAMLRDPDGYVWAVGVIDRSQGT
jgi:uncharacterized glyoxalase superfamily protein PhnB